ncbi:cysteine desulfurase family protein (TIGR01976 family) [Jatrophihabitans sp. GAS493]|uniref:aminotransferase class V-fold PLP-dependent enzyme n=1 Tax=Jatrophihabitans sp. GAS493 TaxID=1907575 RepID=UPI000BBFF82B|nr:aminotransferase class V-fold PLP-dependent enzyme [Jatrophihabitans sp. GAS493]SOD71070.1 cysteine desulfurase family protein (TIGR01976 family) [Jatrophihabitans sp. GAS493]
MFDVARVRGLYPTLGSGIAHLEGSYSALLPETVVRAIITTLRSSPAQPGSRSARSQRSAAAVRDARRAVADLVNTPADDVMLGANVSTLLGRFVDVVSQDWQLGDEIVLSRLDHDANVRPWLRAAKASGAIVQWAEVDVETGELPDWQYEKLINRRTRLVTVPLANPATGTVPATGHISEMAHDVGALVVVDAGAALPHMPIDMVALGADVLSISATTFGGPTLGIMGARPGLMSELERPGSLPGRQRFEVGSLPVELIDGLTAAIDHLAGLDEWAVGSRRERLVTSLTAAGEYQSKLFDAARNRLERLRGVTLLGSSETRLPVAGFTVAGRSPTQVGEMLYDYDVSVWTGENGLTELMRAIGADELGGTVHFGVMPHTTGDEIDQFIDALSMIARR